MLLAICHSSKLQQDASSWLRQTAIHLHASFSNAGLPLEIVIHVHCHFHKFGESHTKSSHRPVVDGTAAKTGLPNLRHEALH